jgi:hypothetical protein
MRRKSPKVHHPPPPGFLGGAESKGVKSRGRVSADSTGFKVLCSDTSWDPDENNKEKTSSVTYKVHYYKEFVRKDCEGMPERLKI